MSAVTAILTEGSGAPGFSQLLRQLGDVWTTEVEGLVYETVERKTMAESALPELFDFLLERDAERAVGVLQTLITERAEPTEPRAVAAAAALLAKRERGIATVLSDLESDRAFAREVLGAVSRHFFTPYDHVLREEQDDADLGRLFALLAEEFPFATDPEHGHGAYAPGLRDSLKDFRDSVLITLRSRATPESCDVLQSVISRFPEAPFLQYSLAHAEENMLEQSWEVPRPQDVLDAVRNHERRFARTEKELRSVVLEALARVQERLQGVTPEANLLWESHRPRAENVLSDYVKNRLNDELRGRRIFLGREVEIKKGSGLGEEADIWIEAFPAGNRGDSLKVVIEVKGCWNPDLMVAMKTQLLDRYMRNVSHEGIYLAVWFDQETWDSADARRRRRGALPIADLKARLVEQATELSVTPDHVAAVVLDASVRQKRPKSEKTKSKKTKSKKTKRLPSQEKRIDRSRGSRAGGNRRLSKKGAGRPRRGSSVPFRKRLLSRTSRRRERPPRG